MDPNQPYGSLSPTRRPVAGGRPRSLPPVSAPDSSRPPTSEVLRPFATSSLAAQSNLQSISQSVQSRNALSPGAPQRQPQQQPQLLSPGVAPSQPRVNPFAIPPASLSPPLGRTNYGAAGPASGGQRPPGSGVTQKAKAPVSVRSAQSQASARSVKSEESTPLKSDRAGNSLLKSPLAWLQAICEVFSWKLLVMIIAAQHILKGFVGGGGEEGLIGMPVFFLLKEPPLKLEAAELQIAKACMIAPWALRPLIGIVSDSIPIFGYRKLSYMVITSVLSVIAMLAIGFNLVTSSVTGLLACLILGQLQLSTLDLLVKAKVSEVVKDAPSIGPEFMQFQWIGTNVGQICGMLTVGLLIQYSSYTVSYLVAAPFCAMVLWPVLGNYLGDEKVDYKLRDTCQAWKAHPTLIFLTLFYGACVVFTVVMVYLLLCHEFSQDTVLWSFVVVVILLLSAMLVFLRKEIGPVMCFWFLQSLSYISIDGALFFFYTNDPEKYPDGPHFSPLFFTTGIGLAGLTGVLIGYITGTSIFKTWGYRSIIVLTTVIRSLARLLLIPVLLRWTHSTMGGGEALYVMAVVCTDAIAAAWCWIPKEVMMSHLAPRGLEAMVMSLFVGSCIFATIIGEFSGNYLLRKLEIQPCPDKNAENYVLEFDKLWQAQVFTALAPCLVLVLVPLCIPSCSQTEKLLIEEDTSASCNSIWERMTSRR